jgi:hypothetical protein
MRQVQVDCMRPGNIGTAIAEEDCLFDTLHTRQIAWLLLNEQERGTGLHGLSREYPR